VLSFPPSVRIYLAAGVTDMRKSFDGLAAVTESLLRLDPLSGHVFVFCNRRKDRLKLLFWDRSGYWCLAKRLEQGTFAWPDSDPVAKLEMSTRELMLILEGIDHRDVKFRKRMNRIPA
jgi:transposase